MIRNYTSAYNQFNPLLQNKQFQLSDNFGDAMKLYNHPVQNYSISANDFNYNKQNQNVDFTKPYAFEQDTLRYRLQQNDNEQFNNLNVKLQKKTLESADKLDQAGGDISKLNFKDKVRLGSIGEGGSSVAAKLGQHLQSIGGKSGILGGVGNYIDSADGLIPHKQQSGLTETVNKAFDQASNAVMKINPLAGTIMKAGGFVADGLTTLGVGTDQMTTADKLLDSKFLKLTPMGLLNAFGAKAADKINKDDEAFSQVGSSYSSSENDVNNATKKSGKKYGLFSNRARKKANRQIREAKRQQLLIGDIADQASIDKLTEQSMSDIYANKMEFDSQGGFNSRMSVGRNGMKIFSKEYLKRAKNISQFTLKPKEQNTQIFKNGGKVNVIPEGALHARLNHLDVDNITNKGIPVIAKDGNKIEQQAEIEVNEIIFHKDLTLELEKLWKEGTDEAAIKAGKLLVKEILENTEDNTGLIDQVET